jgi:hypothetical protein
MAAADDDGARLRPPVSRLHLLVSDLPVLGFVGRDEVVNAPVRWQTLRQALERFL